MESPAIRFDPNPTLGALQIGVLISCLLFGLTTMQTYIYYTRFPDDPRMLKALVAFVWSCELALVVCSADTLYRYTILDYGHPERLLQRTPSSLEAAVFFCGIIAASVQSFFSHRIYSLSKTLYIPLLTWILSFLRLLASTTAFVSGLLMVNFVSYEAQWGWLGISLWSVSTANDFIIAGTLVFFLIRQRRNAQKTTAAVVDRLIAWTIETGMATSAFGIATLICYLTMAGNFIWIGLFIVGARLFSNSLLASLNSRVTLRALSEASLSHSTPVINFSTPPSSNIDRLSLTEMLRSTQWDDERRQWDVLTSAIKDTSGAMKDVST
ncbi:hypothetical protein C8F04DRAFT_644527 [Mycena alexandri]|uniref:DUF6534 domain-containing protein n=1 Tax=Mycena alexandri TaxID=1745969 RepID=A0AAD6WZ02_9AGAR|nr:hypothetical protein C8F04DRAFT_644527 [Mycena alexandri]